MVFSGREARLNCVMFMILQKEVLTSYGMYLKIREIKGYRHTKRQNVDRRMKVLHRQGWIVQNGIRPARAHFPSPLFELSLKAEAAMALSGWDLNDFLQTTSEDQLRKLIDALSIRP